MKKILALLVVVSAPGLAHAAAFQNGSFEAGSLGNIASFDMLGTGSTAITGWTVTGGNIDYIGGLWAAADGARSLDMVGNSLGTIAQTFDTTSGAKYKVGFSMSVNPANPNYSLTRQMRVTAGDEFADYAYTATNNNWVFVKECG